jgi:hypothetical protein
MCAENRGDRAKLRLTRGSVYLCYAQADGNGAKTVSLARFGDYDVRLVEFVRTRPTDPTPMWLELYNHQTQSGIDSCCCYDLEEAVHATEDLISRARELATKERGSARDGNQGS